MSDNRDVEKDDIIAMMRLKSSRNVVWRWLKMSGVFDCALNSDPVILAANVGRSDYAKMIIETLKDAAPEEYKLMIRENML